MTETEIHRAVQYVTAATSYDRAAIAEIVRTGLAELAALATTSTTRFDRETLQSYVCSWTVKRTGHQEPMVREVLDAASRWLDEVYAAVLREQPNLLTESEDSGAA